MSYWDRFNRRYGRRKFLGTAGAAGIGAASWALVSCGDDDDDAEPDPTTPASTSTSGGTTGTATSAATPTLPADLSKMTLEQMRTVFSGSRLKDLPEQKAGPVSGGTARFGSRTPTNWDPTSPAGSLLSSYLFAHNQLVQFKVNDFVKNPNFMEIEPVLAKTMPEQPDELTFTFKLHEGVKFQDVAPVNGRELTSEDIAYAVEAYREAPAQAPTFLDVASVETPDKYTVTFKMARPAAYFLGTIVIPFHWIFSREQHESPDGLGKVPIGTGAFLFESSENLQGYKFARNPAYFRKDDRTGKQLPYLDRLETSYYPSPAQSIAAFRAGELDHLWPQNFQDWLNVMESNDDSVTQITTPPPSFQPFIAMRVDKEPLNDPRVRRALSLLIDRDAIIDSLSYGMAGYGYGQDWTYFGSEWPFEPDKLGKWMKGDVKEAKDLLSAAGADDLKLDFLMTQTAGFNFEVWNAVAGLWDAAGVSTTIDAPQDPAQWQQQYYGGTYNHLTGTGYIGPGWDPDTFAYHALHSKSTKNYFKVNDPKIDELALKQRQTMDDEERKQLLTELMEYDLDQVTRLWTVAPYKINLRKPNFFNLIDTEAAWNPVGWGSCGMDTAWKA
jgi:ABC-type transport system substrate-binding protein